MASKSELGDAAEWAGSDELVETPDGKGEIVAAAQIPGDWRIRVVLEDGGTWTGSIQELGGAGDIQVFERFKRTLQGA